MNDRIKILVVLAIAAFLFLLVEFLKQRRRDRQPTITIRAEVIGNNTNLDNIIYSSQYTRDGGTVRTVTFRTAEGQDVTLTVSRETYWAAEPGVTGILTYQGTKCERFDPDK